MAVYVDALIEYGGSATFRWKESCHMYADTLEELHEFAKKVGLKREWFQPSPHLCHYDLNGSKRILALRNGAIAHKDRIQSTHKWGQLRWQFAAHLNMKEGKSESTTA